MFSIFTIEKWIIYCLHPLHSHYLVENTFRPNEKINYNKDGRNYELLNCIK